MTSSTAASATQAGTENPTGTTPFVSQDGSVLTIVISTSAAGTSLARESFAPAVAALRSVTRGEREVGAILLVGTGPNFCAGGNVRAFAGAEDRPDFLRDLADDFHELVEALHEADRPIVAAVKGWAAGAGMSLVLHADIAVGGNSTKLRPAYGGIGFSPDGGMTWTLPRTVGAARARHIILTDRVISASEALEWGILSEIVADTDIEATARAAAEKITTGPWQTNAATRRLLKQSASASLTEQLTAEAKSISKLSGSPEGREGVDAFIGKRSPDFAAARAR